jgi:hypothetical protein
MTRFSDRGNVRMVDSDNTVVYKVEDCNDGQPFKTLLRGDSRYPSLDDNS